MPASGVPASSSGRSQASGGGSGMSDPTSGIWPSRARASPFSTQPRPNSEPSKPQAPFAVQQPNALSGPVAAPPAAAPSAPRSMLGHRVSGTANSSQAAPSDAAAPQMPCEASWQHGTPDGNEITAPSPPIKLVSGFERGAHILFPHGTDGGAGVPATPPVCPAPALAPMPEVPPPPPTPAPETGEGSLGSPSSPQLEAARHMTATDKLSNTLRG